MACQQGKLTFPDMFVLQLFRLDFSNLPCLYSTFHLKFPSVLSRFCFFSVKVNGRKSIKVPIKAVANREIHKYSELRTVVQVNERLLSRQFVENLLNLVVDVHMDVNNKKMGCKISFTKLHFYIVASTPLVAQFGSIVWKMQERNVYMSVAD